MVEMVSQDLRGGVLLTRLWERSESGDPVVETTFRRYKPLGVRCCWEQFDTTANGVVEVLGGAGMSRIWAACWLVFLRKVTPWVLHGELTRTGEAEFFLRLASSADAPASAAEADVLL